MAFCTRCGSNLQEGSMVCPNCGAPVNQAQNQSFDFNQVTDMPDHTNEFDPADIQQNKILAVLGYIGILFLVPLLAAPNSRFAKFHANQGLVLFLLEMVWNIVTQIIVAVLGVFIKNTFFISAIFGLLSIALLVLACLGIYNAATGKAKELPVIGKIKIIK